MNDPLSSLRSLREKTPLPIAGLAWREPHRVWFRLVGQICAVGSSRSWDTLEALGLWDSLSLDAIRQLPEEEAVAVIHGYLARAQVRYCSSDRTESVKAEAIVRNAHHSAFDSGEAAFLLWLQQEGGKPDERGVFSHGQACSARARLVREMHFFGPKSASDFLVGLGLADSLLALDVRLLNLLVDYLGWDPEIRRDVHRLHRYEERETEIVARLAAPLGWSAAELDRVLFYHYADLKRLWRSDIPQGSRLP